MNMIKCCKDCKERHLNCHSECERYLAEKSASIKDQREWSNGRIMHEYRYDKNTKIKRKMHKR